MAQGMTIRVRMHPMYADFIKNDFGVNEKQQVFASERHIIGRLIKNLLRTNPTIQEKREYYRKAYVEFIIPDYDDVNTDYRNYISENSERIIASKVKSWFYYELHNFIMSMEECGLTEIRRVIMMFCEQFKIDDQSFKINSLEREYRRYRERVEIVKKTRRIASSFEAFLSFMIPNIVLFIAI
jgi:hypothetical protein